MKQAYKIRADSVVIHNLEKPKRRSGRVRPRRDVLHSVPQPVELGGNEHLGRRSPVTEDTDVHLGSASKIADDIQPTASHETPSSSGASGLSSPGYTTPRVEGDAANGSVSAAVASPPNDVTAAPRVYYQDRHLTLYHGDCLADPSLWLDADVLVTDPPYGLQKLAGSYGFASSRRGSVTIANDMDTTVRDSVLELWGDRPVAVFGTPRLEEPPGGWRDRLVWDKGQLGLNGGPWRYAHETIFVRGEGWARVSDSSSSILRFSSGSNRAHLARHIHSKPERLLVELLSAAPPGTIVDPFAGGGSTIAAARVLGRHIIAFELEEQYCEAIAERVNSRLDLADL